MIQADSYPMRYDWQTHVLSATTAVPPVAPAYGDRYIIPAVPAGVWVGHALQVTQWDGNAWEFLAPAIDWTCWSVDDGLQYTWNGAAWIVTGGLGILGPFLLRDATNTMTGGPVSFEAAVAAPGWRQNDSTVAAGADITGYPMTYQAQAVKQANAGKANFGATAYLRGGDAQNLGAGGLAYGGAVVVASGHGASGDGSIALAIGGTSTLTLFSNDLSWNPLIPGVYIDQGNRLAFGAAANFTLSAQNSLVAGAGQNTGGALIGLGGIAQADGTQNAVGGQVTLTGGAASQTAGGGVVTGGGAVNVRGGAATGFGGTGAAAGGNATFGGGGATGGVSNTGGSTFIDTGAGVGGTSGVLYLCVGGVSQLFMPSGGGILNWMNSIATPVMAQADLGAVGTGQLMTLHSQDSLFAGAGGGNVGGAFLGRAGRASGSTNAAGNVGGLWESCGGNATSDATHLATGGGLLGRGGDATQTADGAAVITGGASWLRGGRALGFAAASTLSTLVGGSMEVSGGNAGYNLDTTTYYRGASATGGASLFRAGDGYGQTLLACAGGLTTVRGGNATSLGGAGSSAIAGDLLLSGGTASGGVAVNTQGNVRFGSTNVLWDTAVTTPTLWQADSTVAAGAAITGIAMSIHAQNVLLSNGAFTNTGAVLTVQAGNALNAGGGSSYGGNLILAGGTGTTAGGLVAIRWNGLNRMYVADANAFTFDASNCSAPNILQANKAASGSGALFTLNAQDSPVAGAPNIGGGLNVRAGNATNGTTNTGGNLNLSSGSGATANGNLTLQVGGTAWLQLTASLYAIKIFSVNVLTWTTGLTPLINQTQLAAVGAGTAFNINAQDSLTAAAGANTGGTFTGRAGNAAAGTGAANIGGALSWSGGSGTGTAGQLGTGGNATYAAGAAAGVGTTSLGGTLLCNGGDVSGAYTVAGNGGLATFRGGNIGSAGTPAAPLLVSTAGASIFQGGDAWSAGTAAVYTVTGGTATLRGGNVALTVAGAGTIAQAGHVLIAGGAASGAATNYSGNIAFNALPASWQNGVRTLFIGECVTVPTGNPTAGVFIYVEGGAGKGRGTTSGTITTFIASEPHCQRCGCDFAVEWENPKYGGKHSICMKCLVDTLERHGIKPDEYVIQRAAA